MSECNDQGVRAALGDLISQKNKRTRINACLGHALKLVACLAVVTSIVLLGVFIERQKDSVVNSGVLVSKATGEPVKTASSLFDIDKRGALVAAAESTTAANRSTSPHMPVATSQVRLCNLCFRS